MPGHRPRAATRRHLRAAGFPQKKRTPLGIAAKGGTCCTAQAHTVRSAEFPPPPLPAILGYLASNFSLRSAAGTNGALEYFSEYTPGRRTAGSNSREASVPSRLEATLHALISKGNCHQLA